MKAENADLKQNTQNKESHVFLLFSASNKQIK